ncbi:MAG: heat-shock protein [Chloroflexi bacterium]|nr:heat-shock protein [Chloroflexota bacterium]|tara:strand:+ start:12238 stop:12678 length:441 start_codon:yes stop_codon:yes gene_type:complete
MKNNNTLPSGFLRTTIGFENLLTELEKAFTTQVKPQQFPKYNIIKISDTETQLEVALAGYNEKEIDIELHNKRLTIKTDSLEQETEEESEKYMHRGIAKRNFTLGFNLSEHLEVVSANMENGMLYIRFELKIPEEKKAKKIEIQSL